MIIQAVTIKLYAPWVHSLKEKRMIVKSIIAKTQNKFNVSIADVDEQDRHQTIILGVVCVANKVDQTDSIIDHVVKFIENNTRTEILEIHRDIR